MPFVSAAGARLAYRGEEEGERGVVFVHGAGQSSLTFLRVLTLLAKDGLRPLALDLPGHGKSAGPAPASVEESREALRTFVTAMSLDRPILVGHSMGAAVVLDYALAYPGDASGLVLAAGAPSFAGQGAVVRMLDEKPGAFQRDFAARAFARSLSAGDALAATKELLAAPPEVVRKDFAACDRFNVRHRLGDVITPALVVAGKDDRVVAAPDAKVLATELRDARLVELAGGHMLPHEQPAAFASAIVTFAAELRARREGAPVAARVGPR